MKGKKKGLIVTLSVITAIALSWAVLFAGQPKVFAKAVNASDISLFTVNSKANTSMTGIEVDTSKNVGEINGIFSGNFEMEFNFSSAGFGSTEVAFYDKDDKTTKVFSVVYTIKDGNVGSALVFDYRDNTFHAFNESGDISSINQWTVDHFNIGYEVEAYPNTYKSSVVGKLGVYYSGDTVSIKVSEGWNGEVSDFVELATLTVSGLSDGYLVKLESNSVYSNLGRSVGYDSVVVKSVNGIDFMSGELENYTLNGEIKYAGEYSEDTKNIIEISEAQELNKFKFVGSVSIDCSSSGLGQFISSSDAEILFDVEQSFGEKEVGSYDITVVFQEIQKDYTVKVKEGDTCTPVDLFTYESDVTKIENGVRVNNSNASAVINSTLVGDFELEFAFTQSGFFSNEIAFYSKNDMTEKVFSVVYSIKDNDVGTALVFDYRDNTYHAFNESGGISTINQWTNDHFNIGYQVEAYPNSLRNSVLGKLGVYFDGDNATIKVSEGWNGEVTNFVKLAELSVPSLKDGYIVKIEGNTVYSNLSRTKGTDKLLISSVNGISLAKEKIACDIYEETIEHVDEYLKDGVPAIETTEGNSIGKFNYVKKFKIDCSNGGFCEFNCRNSITKFDLETDYQNKPFGEYNETVKYGDTQKDYLIIIKKGDLVKSKDVLSNNEEVKYFEDEFNKGYAVNTKDHDIQIGEYLYGDLELEYAYSKNGYGTTEFTVYDKDAPDTKVFSVLRTFNYDNKGTAFVVDYRGESPKAIALDVVSGLDEVNAYYPWSVANSDDQKEIYPNNAGNYATVGKLGLFFNDDKVEIKVSQGWNGEVTNYLTLATLTVPDLSDGYVLKLLGSSIIREKGDNSIVITSINGYNLSRENLPCRIIESSLRHPSEYLKNDKAYIDVPLGGNITPFDFVNRVDISGVIISATAETFTTTKTVSDKKVGEYPLTISHNGISKDYTVNVVPAYKTDTIFTENSNATFVTAGGNSGVRVRPYKQEATFNGLFNGDLELEFAYEYSSYGTTRFNFYDKDNPNQIVFTIYRSFGIGRPDRIAQGFVETTWGTAFVEYNGKYYALEQEFTSATDAVLYCQDRNVSYYPVNNTKASDPHCNFTDKWNIPGKLILTWNGDNLTIEATVGEGASVTGKNTLAVLNLPNFKDGYNIRLTGQGYDSSHECEENVMILGINGTKFDNTYTGSSFYSSGINYNSFKNQDGEIYVAKNNKLGEFTCVSNYEYYALRWQKSLLDDKEFINAGFNVEYDVDLSTVGTKQVTVTPYLYGFSGQSKTFNIVVEDSAKIQLNENGGENIDDIYYSQHTFGFELPTATKDNWKFGGWYKDGVLFEGISEFTSLTDMTLTAHYYDDESPEMNFKDGIFEVISITEETAKLDISNEDVVAYDKATDKTFAKDEIVVTVKAPNSENYVSLDQFTFNNKLYGVYFVKYSATDCWTLSGDIINNKNHTVNNVGELIRVINYSAEKPTITLASQVATVVYVGTKVQIPNATAKSGNTTINCNVSLTVQNKDGEIKSIEIKDGIIYEYEGTYQLVYFAEDACGQATMEKYEIVCKKDTNKPQINVTFNVTQIEVGQTLTIPKATAIDNEFGPVNVSVEILYQNNVVATDSFTVNKDGLYTVRYTAKDGVNNVEIKEFDVVAINTTTETPTESGGGCSGNINSAESGVLILTLLASVLLFIKKRSTL